MARQATPRRQAAIKGLLMAVDLRRAAGPSAGRA
jgi:hypothetical protein